MQGGTGCRSETDLAPGPAQEWGGEVRMPPGTAARRFRRPWQTTRTGTCTGDGRTAPSRIRSAVLKGAEASGDAPPAVRHPGRVEGHGTKGLRYFQTVRSRLKQLVKGRPETR